MIFTISQNVSVCLFIFKKNAVNQLHIIIYKNEEFENCQEYTVIYFCKRKLQHNNDHNTNIENEQDMAQFVGAREQTLEP